MIYGHAWASTDGRRREAQAKQLCAAGAEKVEKGTVAASSANSFAHCCWIASHIEHVSAEEIRRRTR